MPVEDDAPPPRMLVVADSDSYLKWAVSRAVESRERWDVEVVVVRSAVTPSSEQIDAAVDGRWDGAVDAVRFQNLVRGLKESPPEALLLACRGPLIEMVVRALSDHPAPPVTVCGIPGIWLPPTSLGLRLRRGTDLMIVHSRRERTEAQQLAHEVGGPTRLGLASLVNRPAQAGTSSGGTVVFAPQALVPKELDDRTALLEALARTARAHPHLTVVIKERGRLGEVQTHRDSYPFFHLLANLRDRPANLVVGYGPMSRYLNEDCAGFVTVSSTAVLEAIEAGVPSLCLNDFGVNEQNINLVFEDSGLLSSMTQLERAEFAWPDPAWLDDNYFHGGEQTDWLDLIDGIRAGSERAVRGSAQRRDPREWVASLRARRVALGANDESSMRVVTWFAASASRASWFVLARMRRQ